MPLQCCAVIRTARRIRHCSMRFAWQTEHNGKWRTKCLHTPWDETGRLFRRIKSRSAAPEQHWARATRGVVRLPRHVWLWPLRCKNNATIISPKRKTVDLCLWYHFISGCLLFAFLIIICCVYYVYLIVCCIFDGWDLWGTGHKHASDALEKKGKPERAFRHNRADNAKLEKVCGGWTDGNTTY